MSNAVLRTGITSRVLGAAIGVCVAASALAACGGTSGASGSDTFTFGMSSDPGNLDPQSSASGNLYQMSYFAYDPLLNVDSTGQQHGYEFWRDEVNAAGGIKAGGKTYKVKFATYDDQSVGGRVQQLYTRLINQDKANFLFSPYSSGLTAPGILAITS